MKIKSRYPETLEYNVSSRWDGKTGGIATVSHEREIAFDTPTTYGGRESAVCPDEMFLASLLGCLNNTFLDFQRRFEMELLSLDLKGRAISKFDSDGYKITEIKIWGEVVVGEDELDTGKRCVELMKKYCHLSRSIKECIPITVEVTVREELH